VNESLQETLRKRIFEAVLQRNNGYVLGMNGAIIEKDFDNEVLFADQQKEIKEMLIDHINKNNANPEDVSDVIIRHYAVSSHKDQKTEKILYRHNFVFRCKFIP